MTESEGKTLAERYCSGAEHCRQEVRAMLERRGAESADIDSIIGYLVKEGYIDESRYARAFVHDKVRFAKWGRIKIAQALWQKRIPQDIADAALSSIDEDEYLAALKEVLKSRCRTVKGATEYERKMKTMKTVCGRGYESSLVRKILDFSDGPDSLSD
ncbi:MAG: RecX family transcriptional regulator [Bacteroidaceae bacterium]|nr:RecX family transcriptional regulator [Bacteroidaceae bacterium]